jgi:tRNA-uridine 2-sulfurtransferase
MQKKPIPKVFVGMSGGVDSSVSAALLKEAGYDVTGVFIKAWHPDFLPCDWRADRLDAMRVCAKLSIPFFTLDLEEAYKKEVVDYMIREYREGKTPNPDVMCNKYIKFGHFFTWAMEKGADFVATGHYATLEQRNGVSYLAASADTDKDQTYFLWTLSQQILSRTLFPVGGMKKDDVRKEAKRFGLPNATKKDSQGLCFLGKIDMKEFLASYIPEHRGDVLNTHGKIIGYHNGAAFLTIGERHGFTISTKTASDVPLYVVYKDIKHNTITVGTRAEIAPTQNTIFLESLHSSSGQPFVDDTPMLVRTRYRQQLQPCTIHYIDHDYNKPTLTIKSSKENLSPGQSAVFYNLKGDICLGGAIIKKV